jgi:hypothetical protein
MRYVWCTSLWTTYNTSQVFAIPSVLKSWRIWRQFSERWFTYDNTLQRNSFHVNLQLSEETEYMLLYIYVFHGPEVSVRNPT